VIGGVLIDVGRERGATGRLSAMRMVMQNGAALAAGPLGGWMAATNFRLAPITAGFLMASLGIVAWELMREPSRRVARREVLANTGRQVRAILLSWPLLATVALTFLHYVAPGFQSLLYYHQRSALGMDDKQIGLVGMVGGITAVLGALTYGLICRRLSLRALLYGGMAINAASILFFFGYRSYGAAYWVEALAGYVSMLGLLPLYDLSARATPRGSEALGYSLIMAVGNFAIGLSDVFGTQLSRAYHLRFFDMIWINAATTGAILFFIPFLPRILVMRREGDADSARAA
jgi:hypothetical protein